MKTFKSWIESGSPRDEDNDPVLEVVTTGKEASNSDVQMASPSAGQGDPHKMLLPLAKGNQLYRLQQYYCANAFLIRHLYHKSQCQAAATEMI